MPIDKKKEKEMALKSNFYPYSKCLNCIAKIEKNDFLKNWCHLCNQESRTYER
ncbi:MAG: hypothetical protein QW757_05325 [Candidatus Woesearchaeota archaeon]